MNDSKIKKKQTMNKQYRENRKKKQSLKKTSKIKRDKHKVISDDTHIEHRKRKAAPKKVSSVDHQKIKKKSSSKASKKSRPRNHDRMVPKKDQQSALKTKPRPKKKKVSTQSKKPKPIPRDRIIRKKKKSGLKIFLISLVIVVALILSSLGIVGYFLTDKYKREIIHNEDMAPYLVPDEEIIVEKNDHPKRFDIIAYHSAEDNDLTDVGRVIGLPGDTVEYLFNKLYINDREYEEPYLPSFIDEKVDSGSFSLIEVPGAEGDVIPQGYYLVLGDNRNDAEDSRVTGLVPQTHVIGIVRYRYESLFNLEKIEPYSIDDHLIIDK